MNEFASMCAFTPPGMSSSWGHIGGSYFNKVAAMVFPGNNLRPRVRSASVVPARVCPTIKVIDGKCSMLNNGHLGKLTHKNMIGKIIEDDTAMWFQQKK